jgi:hypothetical protein
VSGGDHRRGGGQRASDAAGVDRGPRGLRSGAENGVGRAADPDPGGRGRPQDARRVVEGDRERLLRVDVFAVLDGGQADREVRGRDREVEHRVDVGTRHQPVDRECLGVLEPGGRRGRPRRVEVGHRRDADVGVTRERGEVRARDGAEPDDADPVGFVHRDNYALMTS